MVGILHQMFVDRGYHNDRSNVGVYEKGSHRIFLGIVDDITQGKRCTSGDFYNELGNDHLVITDNWILRPVSAEVLYLPDSWFGIYAHRPQILCELPDRAFSMPVNRIDVNRLAILLRMEMYGHIDQGYVNFNCFDPGSQGDNDQRLKNWSVTCEMIQDQYGHKYDQEMSVLTARMPLKNHDMEFDNAVQSGGLHMVIETYCSDRCISFSEKIFRALCLPRPWTLLASPWAVARLIQLGFDVMADLVDHHSYDGLRMVDDKLPRFVAVSREHWGAWSDTVTPHTIHSYQRWYRRFVLPRARTAAEHNIDLLARMRHTWWQDFGKFVDNIQKRLK